MEGITPQVNGLGKIRYTKDTQIPDFDTLAMDGLTGCTIPAVEVVKQWRKYRVLTLCKRNVAAILLVALLEGMCPSGCAHGLKLWSSIVKITTSQSGQMGNPGP